MNTVRPFDPSTLRERLAGLRGPAYWHRLEELSDTPEFRRFVQRKFPAAAGRLGGAGRRGFLRIMAASFALGGLAACNRHNGNETQSRIVPYVHPATRLSPGEPEYYASSHVIDGMANGVVITSVDGRPIKVEGNAQHPWSLGGTDVFGQASVLGLYDPDRSQSVLQAGRPSDWTSLQQVLLTRFGQEQAIGGQGLRLLTGPISSPSVLAQVAALRHALPKLHWHIHAAMGRTAVHQAAAMVYGRPLDTQLRFDRADLVVALEGDFLDPGTHQVGLAERWSAARRAAYQHGRLLRLNAVTASPNLTSAKADDVVTVAPGQLPQVAAALSAAIAGQAGSGNDPLSRWVRDTAAALKAAPGRSIVTTGITQPVGLQAEVHRLNAALGNLGQTVILTQPVTAQAEPLAPLVEAMHQGTVATLIMLDVNPVYDAPGDLEFAAALQQVPLKLHAGEYADETALRCDWHAPLAHVMERWGDARAPDGTVSVIQPMVRPFYGGRSVAEMLSLIYEPIPRDGRTILKSFWQQQQSDAAFAPRWQKMLRDGFIADTAFPAQNVQPQPPTPATATDPAGRPTTTDPSGRPTATDPSGITLLIRPDPTMFDGRLSNNAWLQETPKPLTKTVWQNVVAVSPALAKRLHLHNGDDIEVSAGGQNIVGPAWILPGQAAETVTVYLGYGREAAGSVGSAIGYNAYVLQTGHSWQVSGVTVRRTGQSQTVPCTQELRRMEGDDLVRVQPVGAAPVGDPDRQQPTLYPKWPTDGRAWGMVIDLDSCIGCNACVVSCQAENNIPSVGPGEVIAGRDMHWLRVDVYDSGPEPSPSRRFMPVPCMQCENAPCELGCPVEATLHDEEGLNLMVYNRCVGTRACAAYCPYKVRHFNFTDYAYEVPPSVQAQYNPEVTVRARGVMEKCTYCVQRIVAARIQSDVDNKPIPDGAVKTACQAACPTRAITFGDMQDKSSAVRAARHEPRNYALLGELGTRPRTTYLAMLAPGEPEKA